MYKSLCLLIALTSFGLFADDKIEKEFNLPLSVKNYKILKEKFLVLNAKEKSREDFYFDLYAKESYVLSAFFKIRLMIRPNSSEWQVQKKIFQSKLGLFSVTETQAFQKEVIDSQTIKKMALLYLNQLKELNPIALSTAKKIQQALHEKGLPLFTKAHCQLCEGQTDFYLTHTNKKKRLSLKVKLKSVQLDLSLGETLQEGSIAYELEAEQKSLADNQTTTAQLQEWLREQGFEESDTAPPKKNATAESLKNLKHILQTQY